VSQSSTQTRTDTGSPPTNGSNSVPMHTMLGANPVSSSTSRGGNFGWSSPKRNIPVEEREPRWGPVGDVVHKRSYAAETRSGELEKWWETVTRVVDGNLSLVDARYIEPTEREELIDRIFEFEMLPGGRHMAMSGKPGRQFLFNCHVAGWHHKDIARHFVFTFDQLMQGGGVGANYSDRFLANYPRVRSLPKLHIVCDPEHENAHEMSEYLSDEYSHLWSGCFRIPDTREGWCDALQMLIDSFWSPDEEVLVLDMSLIRPRGRRIRTFGGTSSGPAYVAEMLTKIHALLAQRVGARMRWDDAMTIDHLIASCVVSGNVRRSARMSMKWWSDPGIFDFITAKQREGNHWSTNISVVIDEDFFRALKAKSDHAVKVLRMVVEGMFTNGEPGFYNFSLAMEGEINDVFCTNPCGEIPLPEWGNCNLGHINLEAHCDPQTGSFDFTQCAEGFRLMSRFLTRATFGDVPSPLQRRVNESERRIGVGFTGYHGWLTKMGVRWSESHHNPYVRKSLRDFYEVVRKEVRRYAFNLRIPEPVKCTTLAPVGTVSKLAGCSESMEPIKFRYFEQRIRFSKNPEDPQVQPLRDQGIVIEDATFEPNTLIAVIPCKNKLLEELEHIHGPEKAEWLLEEAAEIPLDDMLAVQQMVQAEYADNAISFTVNRPPDAKQQAFIDEHPDWSWRGESLPLPDDDYLDDALRTIKHFLPRLKGTTVMVDGSRMQAPYTPLTKEQFEASVTTRVAESFDGECAGGACDWAGPEVKTLV
jgi:ribonucleoside-triphosphate reductase (thioredoxin)